MPTSIIEANSPFGLLAYCFSRLSQNVDGGGMLLAGSLAYPEVANSLKFSQEFV